METIPLTTFQQKFLKKLCDAVLSDSELRAFICNHRTGKTTVLKEFDKILDAQHKGKPMPPDHIIKQINPFIK